VCATLMLSSPESGGAEDTLAEPWTQRGDTVLPVTSFSIVMVDPSFLPAQNDSTGNNHQTPPLPPFHPTGLFSRFQDLLSAGSWVLGIPKVSVAS